MMVTDKTYKYTNRRERIIFLVKLIAYAGIVYFNLDHPAGYNKLTWLFKITNALSFFLGANLLISLGWLVVLSWYTRHHRSKPLERDNFVLGINRITSVLNTIFIILALMLFFGIDLLKFVTSITIVAAAIALLSKDYITNMINGLIIMFSDQLSLGDHVRIGEYKGKVLDITLINVVLQNEDDDIVIIPNSVVFTSIVLNQSKQNIKKLTIEFELDHKHPYTPELLEHRLQQSISEYERHYNPESFSLKTLEIKKDFVQFKVQLLMPVSNKETERLIRRALNTEIISIAEG
ncbi:mechanosensitive ion channel family protein [Chitinophaga nivalis]|uniref:Mechanosensitive ion channel family protein n=1 Tax=Chitinophaga nivalis TaxID=2991709 RepID=A0ABT3ILK8_9BACT|nr:mechanosensitive ion channel family protein [Chitinophaga nivalis]MCW3465483.1 mechanosensitive ion channel family protein [Chitinophaga nivalis]MCW3484826.1 mechanosensitive ion channel family protein [Chitinophaga nivalis]